MEPLKKGFVGKRRIIVTSPPHLRLRSNSPIICPWRKQINAGDRAPNDSDWHYGGSPTDCRYSMGSTERRRSWVVSTASTARKRGRGTGRISNLSGSGCSPSGRGGFGGIRSTAKFPTVGHRPILKTRTPESIPSEHWQPRYQRSTGCYGQCCSTDRITN